MDCGYLKWNFRKLCQHLFNLSSCETSSISHNPLSSYYCYWISSCRLCKMKLYFWCQASSNLFVVKLTIFYKEPFYSIQNPFVNFIALHVWGQFCLYWTDDVQYTNYTKIYTHPRFIRSSLLSSPLHLHSALGNKNKDWFIIVAAVHSAWQRAYNYRPPHLTPPTSQYVSLSLMTCQSHKI